MSAKCDVLRNNSASLSAQLSMATVGSSAPVRAATKETQRQTVTERRAAPAPCLQHCASNGNGWTCRTSNSQRLAWRACARGCQRPLRSFASGCISAQSTAMFKRCSSRRPQESVSVQSLWDLPDAEPETASSRPTPRSQGPSRSSPSIRSGRWMRCRPDVRLQRAVRQAPQCFSAPYRRFHGRQLQHPSQQHDQTDSVPKPFQQTP